LFKKLILPIIIFLIGLSFALVGALLKILHFEFGFVTGNILLTVGAIIKVIAIVTAIVKLLSINHKTE
jgi:hypothetical protein